MQPFSRDKLCISLKDACTHRKTALEDASALTDTVLGQVLALNQPVIHVSQLCTIARQTLNRFDSISAAVYEAKHIAK